MSPRKTHRLAGPRHRGLFVDRVPEDLARSWLENPAVFFEGGPGWSEGSPARVTRADSAIGPLFVKEGRRRRYRAWLDALFGRLPASTRAFETGLHLAEMAVGATRPVAVFERRISGESFLLLEFIEAPDLHRYLVSQLEGVDPETRALRKSALWSALAGSVAELHRANVRQRDLKAPNILVEGGDSPRIVFVDLEGMERLPSAPSRQQRERDLARLATSFHAPRLAELGVDDADWSSVVRGYLEAAGLPDETEGWTARTLAWARRKEERQRQRGKEIW